MKNLIILLMVLLQTTCSGQQNKNQKGKNQKQQSTPTKQAGPSRIVTNLKLDVNIGSFGPANVDMAAFNTANTFGNCNVSDADYQQKVKELKPDLLRFPGGSIANFYHLNGKGYGFDQKDFVLNDGSVSKHVHNMLKKNEEIKDGPNYMQEFIKLAKFTGAEVLYVANITSSNPSEVLSIIKTFNDNHIPVRGVVLGNELYLNGYKQLVPNAEAFIKMAMPYAKAIRNAYPKLQIAAPAESRGILNANYKSDWNDRLSSENFFDAIVVHVYPDEPKCDDSNLENLFDCSRDNLSNYVQNIFPDRMTFFAKQYAGKRIWITEWNLKKPGNNIGSTLLQALFAADFIMKVNEWNATAQRIDLMSFHNLSSDEYGYSLINPSGNKYITNSAFYTFKSFAALAGKKWTTKSFNDGNLRVSIFYNAAENKAEVYALNYSGNAVTFNGINWSNSSTKLNPTVATWDNFQGDRLYSTNQTAGFLDGVSKLSDQDDVKKYYSGFKSNTGNATAPSQLAPYSLTRITYDLGN